MFRVQVSGTAYGWCNLNKTRKSIETAAEILEYGLQKDDSDAIEEAYTKLCHSLSKFRFDSSLDAELTEDREKQIAVVKKLESAALLLELDRTTEAVDCMTDVEGEIRYALGEIKN